MNSPPSLASRLTSADAQLPVDRAARAGPRLTQESVGQDVDRLRLSGIAPGPVGAATSLIRGQPARRVAEHEPWRPPAVASGARPPVRDLVRAEMEKLAGVVDVQLSHL